MKADAARGRVSSLTSARLPGPPASPGQPDVVDRFPQTSGDWLRQRGRQSPANTTETFLSHHSVLVRCLELVSGAVFGRRRVVAPTSMDRTRCRAVTPQSILLRLCFA